MRRLVLSLLAASSVALLTACGQGGSAFNTGSTNKATHVIVESAGDPPGSLKVVPGGTIVLSAVATNGPNNSIVIGDSNFTFTYNIAPANTPYPSNVDGQQAFCNGLTGTNGILPAILTSSTTTTPSVTVTSSDGNLIVTAPASIAAFGAATAFSPTTATTYCLNINAIHTSDGVTGSAVLLVTPST
jgi:hypothetical protein